ncbi:melanoregulin isoform X2 [Balearica regulorum gibbericeps]|uniref:melanoregulin isoform X2 n=1 Tax=Balearica regulorum gibbericeps TaxID=100784 RepID=UPI003F5D7769
MGLGAWLRALGGCCGCCGGEAAAPEKEPLLSNNNPYASFGATLARDEEQNLWSTPHDVTHTEADDDRVLYNMIVVRNQLDKDSEEWQKLNYDIYTLRQTRKEVRSRWKHILEDLGFQKEADSLLSVTKLSIISDSQNMGKARDILLKLSEETNIFPTSWELSERYLFVVESDRGVMGARSQAGCFTCPAGSQRQPPSQQFLQRHAESSVSKGCVGNRTSCKPSVTSQHEPC